jgi:hypothetical protein
MSTLSLRALLVVGSLALGLNVPAAEAHQCVKVLILDSPERVQAGSEASLVAGVINCGSCPTPVLLDAWLYDPDTGKRVHLGTESLRQLEGRRRVKLLLDIPRNVAPGRYHLVLSGVTPSGYMDLARARIAVGPGTQRDIRRLLMRLAGDPTDLAAMEELAEAAGDMAGDMADELDPADAIAAYTDITGKIVHKDKKKKKIRVKNETGREKTVKVKPSTVIVDVHGNVLTFDDLREGDRVEVEYNSQDVATNITKL